MQDKTTIYLVRHGESEDSANKLFQRGNSPLSVEGVRQAESIAERFLNIQVDIIIASPLARAAQTAQIIAKKIKKDIEYSDLLVEEKKPSEMEGKFKDDPEAIKIKDILRNNYHDPKFSYSDFETFVKFKNRILELERYLVTLKEKKVLLVSHGIAARMMFCITSFGQDLTSHEFLKISDLLTMSKVGLSIFEYVNGDTWKVVTWNNQTHSI